MDRATWPGETSARARCACTHACVNAARLGAWFDEVVTPEELVDQPPPGSAILGWSALERGARQLAVRGHFRLLLEVSNSELGSVLVDRVSVVWLERVVRAADANLRVVRCERREALHRLRTGPPALLDD